MSGWQSIETAPLDGTEILGWRHDAGVMLMRWLAPVDFLIERELALLDADDTHAEGWFYADFIEGGRLEGTEAPSHWQHLPDGPA